MHQRPTLAESSSFNHGYSSTRSLAARVVEEFKDNEQYDGVVLLETGGEEPGKRGVPERDDVVVHEFEDEVEKEEEGDDDDVSEFEFAALTRDGDSPLSADEIFYNGQIRPIYPLFNWMSSDPAGGCREEEVAVVENVRDSDPKATASCSSSEADELESLPPGTYCVWTPPKNQKMMRKKSNSTGSSKRWKLRELLHRSSSDGKETVVFLTPKEGRAEKSAATAKDMRRSVGSEGGGSGGKVAKGAEVHYLKSRATRERDGKKWNLPYRRDLVGFLANVNSLGKAIQPF